MPVGPLMPTLPPGYQGPARMLGTLSGSTSCPPPKRGWKLPTALRAALAGGPGPSAQGRPGSQLLPAPSTLTPWMTAKLLPLSTPLQACALSPHCPSARTAPPARLGPPPPSVKSLPTLGSSLEPYICPQLSPGVLL